MIDEHRELLRKAVEKRLRKETLEHALGKELRRAGLGYDVYVSLMSEVRDVALDRKIDVLEAAKTMVTEGTAGPSGQ